MITILISIKPKWCEKIANGLKDLEVRKNFPKIETPFRVVVYCTKENINGELIKVGNEETSALLDVPVGMVAGINKGFMKEGDVLLRGKIIGEFVCDGRTPFRPRGLTFDSEIVKRTCVSLNDLINYAPDKPFPHDHLYGWRIKKFKLYDVPKELCEFATICEGLKPYQCDKCEYNYTESNESVGIYHECCCNNLKPLTRPPQSWCYATEINCN